jgi:uncharacterized membrane protein
MNLAQWGLLLDIFGVVAVGFDAWLKTRGIQANTLMVGHGELGCFRFCGFVGWILILVGFILQLIAAGRSP